MNKTKAATVAALAVALALGAACGNGGGDTIDGDHEILINCYDPKTGKLVKKDDDCHDDGLTAIKPQPTPVRTSGGLQTAGPVKPSPAKPRPRRS